MRFSYLLYRRRVPIATTMDFSFHGFSPLVVNNEIEDGIDTSKNKLKRKQNVKKKEENEDLLNSQLFDPVDSGERLIVQDERTCMSDEELDTEIMNIAAKINTGSDEGSSPRKGLNRSSMTTPKRKRDSTEDDDLQLSLMSKRMRGDLSQVPMTSTQIKAPRRTRSISSRSQDSNMDDSQSILSGASPWKTKTSVDPDNRTSQDFFSGLESEITDTEGQTSVFTSPKKKMKTYSVKHKVGQTSIEKSRPKKSKHDISESGTSDDESDTRSPKKKPAVTSPSKRKEGNVKPTGSQSPRRSPRALVIHTPVLESPSKPHPASPRRKMHVEHQLHISSPRKSPRKETPVVESGSSDEEVGSQSSLPRQKVVRYECPPTFEEVDNTDSGMNDLGPDKEIWVIRLPKKFNVQDLHERNVISNGSIDFSVESEENRVNYQMHSAPMDVKHQKSGLLYADGSDKALRLGGHPVRQLWLTQTEVVPPPRRPYPRPYRDTKLPPGLKRRFVPFGSGLPSNLPAFQVPMHRGDSADIRAADHPDSASPDAKVSKKMKKKDAERMEVDETDGVVTSTGTVGEEEAPREKSKKKKKKKNREDKESEGVNEGVVEADVDIASVEGGHQAEHIVAEDELVSEKKKKKKKHKHREEIEIHEEVLEAQTNEEANLVVKKKKKKKHKHSREDTD